MQQRREMGEGKRLYSPRFLFRFFDDVFAHLSDMKLMRDPNLLDEAFFERLMLAVTEVNGCRYCSYFHTGEALKAGLSDAEVQGLLSGDQSEAPEEQAVALVFAQHYAEQAGVPDADAMARLIEVYGELRAQAILSAIRVIMIGNVTGNNFDALVHRLKGQKFEDSSLGSELGVLLGVIPAIPWSLGRKLLGII